MNAAEHVLKRMSSAQLVMNPFPHFYVEDVFPEPVYEELLAKIPQDAHGEKLPKRKLIPFDAGLGSKEFMDGVLECFSLPHWPARCETRLVMDREGYGIGPHTDQPGKLVSMLFYMPKDNADEGIGTSIYEPSDPEFGCEGGKHYKAEGFRKLWTAPFRRNSLFAFWKTDKGFHGVEKIRRPVVRNVLLYNVYQA